MQNIAIIEKRPLKFDWPAPRVWNRASRALPTGAKEQRRFPREWRSQPIWWRQGLTGDVQPGWMVDRSAEGAAFIYRGNQAPLTGTRIETACDYPQASLTNMKDALVRRVRRLHGDLFLVAAQYAGTPSTAQK